MSEEMNKPKSYRISALNGLFLVISVLAAMYSFRLVAFIVAGLFLFVLAFKFSKLNRQLMGSLVLVVFIVMSIQPFDISFINVPGSPRIVPYVIGLPTPKARKEAEKGDVVLGGCFIMGNHPKWLLVW